MKSRITELLSLAESVTDAEEGMYNNIPILDTNAMIGAAHRNHRSLLRIQPTYPGG